MSKYCETEDWGLQAIVGGSNNMDMMDTSKQPHSLGVEQNEDGDDDQSFLFSFSDHFVKSSMLLDDGLEALYKPFHPVLSSKELDEVQGEQELVEMHVCAPSASKRKSQQKRVVNKVKAEDLSSSSDMWAWRKYGQKPIKGSRYPRSYYRCSTMKGCLAKKQVEQSNTDPGIYIVIYKGEHCHNQPARRNSLAGTVRQKFPTPHNKNPMEASGSQTSSIERVVKDSNSSKNVSPTSRGNMESFEESNDKQEKLGKSEDQVIQSGYTHSSQCCFTDFIVDGFFSDLLEDLDEPRDFQQCQQL